MTKEVVKKYGYTLIVYDGEYVEIWEVPYHLWSRLTPEEELLSEFAIWLGFIYNNNFSHTPFQEAYKVRKEDSDIGLLTVVRMKRWKFELLMKFIKNLVKVKEVNEKEFWEILNALFWKTLIDGYESAPLSALRRIDEYLNEKYGLPKTDVYKIIDIIEPD